MLRTDKPIYKVILVFNLLLILLGIVLTLKVFVGADEIMTRIISSIATIACLVFAAFYIISGYTKNAAKYYKVFGTLLVVKYLAGILSGSSKSGTPFGIMVLAFSLVIALVLLLSENLGKTKSLVLCGLLVIISAVDVGVYIRFPISTYSLIAKLVKIDLACLFGIMTYAKYLDKAERGTK